MEEILNELLLEDNLPVSLGLKIAEILVLYVGAISSLLLAFSPLASNLFKAVISESSGAFYPDDPINWWMTPYTVQEAENVSLSHLESVNVNRDITVDKLRDVTVEQLVFFAYFYIKSFQISNKFKNYTNIYFSINKHGNYDGGVKYSMDMLFLFHLKR